MLEFARILRAIEERQRHPVATARDSAAAPDIGLADPPDEWPETPEDETASLIASLREDGENDNIEPSWGSEAPDDGEINAVGVVDSPGPPEGSVEIDGAVPQDDVEIDVGLEPAPPDEDSVMALPGVELDSANDLLEDVVAAESATGQPEDDGLNAAGADGESLEAMIAELKAGIDGETGPPDAALSPGEDADGAEAADIDAQENTPTNALELEALFDDDGAEPGAVDDGDEPSGNDNAGGKFEPAETGDDDSIAGAEADGESDGDEPSPEDDVIIDADDVAEPMAEPGADPDAVSLDVEEAARILDIDGTEEALAVGSGEVEDEALMRQVQEEARRLAENLDSADAGEDEDEGVETGPGEHGQIAAGAAAVGRAPGFMPFQAALSRLIDTLNFPLDFFRLGESTRNAVGYTALMVMLIVVVIVIVILVFHQFTLFV